MLISYFTQNFPTACESKNDLLVYSSGTRFQATGNEDEEEDVAAEHEDKANRAGHFNCVDPHHSTLHLRQPQVPLIFGFPTQVRLYNALSLQQSSFFDI